MGVSFVRREKAMQTIENMPLGEWFRCSDLAKMTPYRGYTVTTLEMMAYLKEAKNKGILEYKKKAVRASDNVYNSRKVGVWRRIQ